MTTPEQPSLPRTPVDARDRSVARRTLLALREGKDWLSNAEDRRIADARIGENTSIWLASLKPGVLGLYWPIRGEPDLSPFLARWRAAGWALALPQVVIRQAPLVFGAWGADTTIVDGPFGIPRPEPFEVVLPTALVLPCVGFDERGYRLGFGGGYYDRTLRARPVPAIGVCLEQGKLVNFEPASHDCRIDAIATPARLLRPAM